MRPLLRVTRKVAAKVHVELTESLVMEPLWIPHCVRHDGLHRTRVLDLHGNGVTLMLLVCLPALKRPDRRPSVA